MSVNVDPRIKISVVADGEVHIEFTLTQDDLAQMAQAFVAVYDGRMQAEDVKMVFRLRSLEGIDYLIAELRRTRQRMFGDRKGGEA